jgi:rhodanese-related sulfurtransferase
MTRVAREAGWIFAAFAIAVVMGVLTNRIRHSPLPASYENPAARMMKTVSAAPTIPEPVVLDFGASRQRWSDPAVLFVDAREPAFFSEGHIPHAINLPREEILQSGALAVLADKSRPLIVYCSGVDCDDSKLVARGLLGLGYTKVAVFPGGWEEWVASGSPVEK